MPVLFDDQTDIAAIVYRPHENPDAVLRAFAEAAARRGWDIAGLLQSTAAAGQAPSKRTQFHLFGSGQPRDWLSEAALAEGMRCSTVLHEAGKALDQALLRQPDLLLISRFGRLELEGGGLLNQVVRAARLNIPALLAVPEALFRPWLAFTGGLCVRIPCTLAGVESWWETVSSQAPVAARAATVCAICK